MNVFREDDEFEEQRWKSSKAKSNIDSGNKSKLSLPDKSNINGDLTSDMLMPLFNDQRIEKKLIDDQRRQKEETAKKNKDRFDLEAQMVQNTNEKGKLPSYPVDSLRQSNSSPLLIADYNSQAPQDFTKLLLH